MTIPRRRIVRPVQTVRCASSGPGLEKAQKSLAQEQVTLGRWMNRLKRAFHAVEKQQRRIAHLQRRIRQLEAT